MSQPAPPVEATGEPAPSHTPGPLLGLAVAAIGIVFGDIGTSPLYALRETFTAHHIAPSA